MPAAPLRWREWLPAAALLAWLAGGLVVAGRQVRDARRVLRLVRQGRPAPPWLAELVRDRRAELAAWQSDENGRAVLPPAWVERCLLVADSAAAFASGMEFRFLYNQQRDLLSIGWNHATGQLDKSHYDLLASEARST